MFGQLEVALARCSTGTGACGSDLVSIQEEQDMQRVQRWFTFSMANKLLSRQLFGCCATGKHDGPALAITCLNIPVQAARDVCNSSHHRAIHWLC